MTNLEYAVEIEKMRPQLIKTAAAFVSDYDAEDIVQEAITYCHAKIQEYDPKESQLSTWVTRKLRQVAIDAIRADDRRKRAEDTTPPEFDPTEEDTGEYRRAQPRQKLGKLEPTYVPRYEDAMDLKGALAELTEKQRETVLAIVVEEYTQEEYAEKTHVSRTTVQANLDGGLRRLRQCLGASLDLGKLAA